MVIKVGVGKHNEGKSCVGVDKENEGKSVIKVGLSNENEGRSFVATIDPRNSPRQTPLHPNEI